MNWLKKSAVKIGLSVARNYIGPELIKDEVRKILTEIASRAHSGDRTRVIMERAAVVLAAMEDGIVNVEETELILGDVVTEENVGKAFDYLAAKVG